jgi:DNA-binding GntR family transcriptional regulator
MAEPTVLLTENDIYERMVATILDHRLQPGTKLVEDRLASAFGVSRTRIRPVLVRLANEQIVRLTPHRGATVVQPTEAEAREVFQVRQLIEPTLVACFIERAQAQDLLVMARCIADEEAARRAGQWRSAIRLAGDFHLHLARVAQHQTLGRMLRELVSRTSLVLMRFGPGPGSGAAQQAVSACGCQEHRALLAALRLRDAAAASRLMREHLQQLEASLRFGAPPEAEPDLMALFGGEVAGGDGVGGFDA